MAAVRFFVPSDFLLTQILEKKKEGEGGRRERDARVAGHRVSEMGVTRWFRIPRCYVWEATKWINEREKRARMEKGIRRTKDKEKC